MIETSQSEGFDYPLCLQFGFTAQNRRARLELMGITDSDRPIIKKIYRHILAPHQKRILEEVYAYLMNFPVMRKFIPSKAVLEKLKLSQAFYLLSFANQFETEEYFEYRLRIGIVHEQIGMPLSLYLASYRKLLELINKAIPDDIRQQPDLYSMLMNTLSKFIMLDMSLAIDTYSFEYNKVLTESIDELTGECDTLTIQLMHDELTGVFTRQFVIGALEKKLAQLKRNPENNIIVALFDLDNFKTINDTYGHLVGDEVLKQFAHTIQKTIRDQDYFGRYGGEEFLMLLTDTDLEQSAILSDRLRCVIASEGVSIDKTSIEYSVSIGLTKAIPGESLTLVIERADKALYIAKQNGRNKVEVL